MELLYIASDLTNALPPYECPIAKIDLLTRQTSARTYEFAQSTPRWIVELCRRGLQSRSRQIESEADQNESESEQRWKWMDRNESDTRCYGGTRYYHDESI